MKVLVTGSRGWTDAQKLGDTLAALKPTLIIHGGARGADRLADEWAKKNGIQTQIHLPDWEGYGKRAGMIRNEQMLNESRPDVVVAFWDGASRGTLHMIGYAGRRRYKVEIVRLDIPVRSRVGSPQG